MRSVLLLSTRALLLVVIGKSQALKLLLLLEQPRLLELVVQAGTPLVSQEIGQQHQPVENGAQVISNLLSNGKLGVEGRQSASSSFARGSS